MFKKIAWIPAALLLTATLTGCREEPEPQVVHEPPPPAPVAVAPAQPAQAAAAPTAPAAQPACDAAIADSKLADRPAPRIEHASSSDLRVKRLVLAEGVSGREPVEPRTSFNAAETERIYAFVEVENRADGEGEITVTFEPPDGGAPRGNVTLNVGASPRWRTWAFTRGARAAGEWTAVVRGPDGQVLARTPFEVTL